LRERVVRACNDGALTRTQIAQIFSVSTAWIRRLLRWRRQTGSFAARPHAGGPAPKLDQRQRQRLLEPVAEDPGATLAEVRHRLGALVHVGTIPAPWPATA
jgi:transposase